MMSQVSRRPTEWVIHPAIEIVSEALCCIILGQSCMFCHLVDLLPIRYTTNFAANTLTNRTVGAYALVYCSYSVDRGR